MFWQDQEEEIETTWQEKSTFYQEWLKNITCSELDYPQWPVFYLETQVENNNINDDGRQDPSSILDFNPIRFQSLYYINTRQGLTIFC